MFFWRERKRWGGSTCPDSSMCRSPHISPVCCHLLVFVILPFLETIVIIHDFNIYQITHSSFLNNAISNVCSLLPQSHTLWLYPSLMSYRHKFLLQKSHFQAFNFPVTTSSPSSALFNNPIDKIFAPHQDSHSIDFTIFSLTDHFFLPFFSLNISTIDKTLG